MHLKVALLTNTESQAWEALVQAAPHSCFMQSWAWADFKQLEGYQTFRYGLFSHNANSTILVGGCIFYLFPHHSKANLLLAPGGPILSDRWAVEGIELLLKQAEEIAKEWGAIALRIEPLLEQTPQWLGTEFARAIADTFPCETLVVDLCQSQEQMLSDMHPKGRYNLRLSWRYGVETQFSQADAAIPQFYDLFWETVERQKFFGEPYGFFINLCQTLFRADLAEIGLATWQGQTLVAILVLYWGDRAYYLYGGRSDRAPHVMASYAIHWAAIQRAKARGCKTYDFYGFSNDPQHAYYKFSRFKQKFGGKVVKTIGAHDYFFYDRLADTLIGLIQNFVGDTTC